MVRGRPELARDRALARLDGEIPVELHFQPFELNPQMPPEGEDATEHLSRKYGAPPEQLAKNRAATCASAAPRSASPSAIGRGSGTPSTRTGCCTGPGWTAAKQRALKHALLAAYHTRAENPGARDVLLRCAAKAVGLDAARAAAMLDSDAYAAEVREREQHWQQLGIHSVPAVVIDDRHLISGGQPPEVFEQALREIAAGDG